MKKIFYLFFILFPILFCIKGDAQLINDNRYFQKDYLLPDSVKQMEILYRVTYSRTTGQYGRSGIIASHPKPRWIILNDSYKVRFNRNNLENYILDVMKRDSTSLLLYNHALLQYKRRNTFRLMALGGLGATFLVWYKYLQNSDKTYYQIGCGTILFSIGAGITTEIFRNRMKTHMDNAMASYTAKFRF